mgnify:CR=1 FL=1
MTEIAYLIALLPLFSFLMIVFFLRWNEKVSSLFSISICSTRMLGEIAETGTDPDSAPHVPLKTAGSSPAQRIFEKQVSGVPTMSTPRTSSGSPRGRPGSMWPTRQRESMPTISRKTRAGR